MLRSFAFAVFAGLACCGATAAQDVHVLMPDSFTVRARESVGLRIAARRDAKFVNVDWPTERVRWYFARGGGTQENRDKVDGNAIVVSQNIEHAGTTVVGVDLKPLVETWDAAAFQAFAEKSLAPGEIKNERQPSADSKSFRVNRIETLKTLIRSSAVGVASRDEVSTVALSKTGQTVEIRLLADPFTTTLGSDIPIKTYVRGDKCSGARVTATCLADGATQVLTTDPTGAAHFTLSGAGKWLVEFHTAEPSTSGDADWVLHSATLTFEVNP